MAETVKDAVKAAAGVGATLVVAFVGHAETLPDPAGGADLYLLPRNGVVPPDSDTGYFLGQRLKEVLGGPAAVGLDGLLLIVDACHAGVGVLNVAQRAAGLVASAGVRLELLAATFDRVARDGCLSETVTMLLGDGLADLSADYIDTASILDRVAQSCPQQEPPVRFAMSRGRRITGDPGLWLARNPEASGRWALAGTPAGGHAVELTRSYQPTEAIERVVAAMSSTRLTLVVGQAGAGKSALVAALARPELAPDLIPASFLHAVAFAALAPTTVELADQLAGQLQRMPQFADACARYRDGFDAEAFDRQPALQRGLLGPVQLLAPHPGRRVRIVIDGVDQLDPVVSADLLDAVARLTADASSAGVRVLLTTRPAGLRSLGDMAGSAARIDLDRPAAEDAAAYALARGVPAGVVRVLVGNADSWLDLQLLTDGMTTLAEPDLGDLGDRGDLEDLDQIYASRLAVVSSALGAQVGPVLAVLSAAGSGPVLPVRVAAGAGARIGGPSDLTGLRDLLAGLGGVVARADPGTDAEHVGLFHDTLVRYLDTHTTAGTVRHAAHQAILAALEVMADDSAAAAYVSLRGPRHLWALGRHGEALAAVTAALGVRAGDNVDALRPWLERANTLLGPDHPDTLITRSNLASWTGRSGDVAGAVRQLEELLEALLRVLGPDHPNTLATRNNLAFWTGESGDVAGAVRQFEEVLEARLRVLGPDHPDTLATRNNLASWRGESGDVAGAVRQLEEVLEARLRVLGPDHPDTLITRNNLASLTGQSGDVVGAARQFEELLEARRRVLGPDHPDTLITRNNLAFWTGESGDVAGAVRQFEEVLEARLRVLGPDHPNTLITRNNLASWTGRSGDVAGAVRQLEELLEALLRVLGPDHPDTLITRNNLASLTGRSGDVVGAVRQFEELLEARRRVLGPDHPDTLATRNNLAFWTGRSGDVAGAVRQFEEVLEALLRVLGPDHPDTLATRSNLASWTGRSGDVAGAVRQLEEVLEARLRVLGPDHPDTLATRSNLASWTGESGDVAGVVRQFEEVLEARLRVLGPDHPDTLITRSNLAFWTGRSGDVAGAVRQFEEVLEARLRVLGPDHPDTLATRNNLSYWVDRT